MGGNGRPCEIVRQIEHSAVGQQQSRNDSISLRILVMDVLGMPRGSSTLATISNVRKFTSSWGYWSQVTSKSEQSSPGGAALGCWSIACKKWQGEWGRAGGLGGGWNKLWVRFLVRTRVVGSGICLEERMFLNILCRYYVPKSMFDLKIKFFISPCFYWKLARWGSELGCDFFRKYKPIGASPRRDYVLTRMVLF